MNYTKVKVYVSDRHATPNFLIYQVEFSVSNLKMHYVLNQINIKFETIPV